MFNQHDHNDIGVLERNPVGVPKRDVLDTIVLGYCNKSVKCFYNISMFRIFIYFKEFKSYDNLLVGSIYDIH